MTRISLPADDAVLLDQLVQWWYWTGHLCTEKGRRFGFQLCFFALAFEKAGHGSVPADGPMDRASPATRDGSLGLQIAHLALTDVENASFHPRILYAPGMPPRLANRFELRTLGPWEHEVTAQGGGSQAQLHGEVDGRVLNLTVSNDDRRHPVVLHHNGQRHDFAFGGYTYHYSRKRMDALGTLTIDGASLEVTGEVWFDRQYGDLTSLVRQGWQWFALQLDNDVQIMLFDINNTRTEGYGSVSRRAKTGALGGDDFKVSVLAHRTNPSSGTVYPAKWHVRVDSDEYIVTPLVADQEVNDYWEGDSVVATCAGETVGRAYVELTGFGHSKKTLAEA